MEEQIIRNQVREKSSSTNVLLLCSQADLWSRYAEDQLVQKWIHRNEWNNKNM